MALVDARAARRKRIRREIGLLALDVHASPSMTLVELTQRVDELVDSIDREFPDENGIFPYTFDGGDDGRAATVPRV